MYEEPSKDTTHPLIHILRDQSELDSESSVINRTIEEARRKALDTITRANLIQEIYLNGFIEDCKIALTL